MYYAVYQSPSQQGKYWNVTATGKAGANGTIRLASVGVNGEATFSKGEWEDVQQVLKAHQAGGNASYRICAEKLMPLFLANFSKTTPAAKPAAAKKPKAVKPPKPATAKSEPAKEADAQPTFSSTKTVFFVYLKQHNYSPAPCRKKVEKNIIWSGKGGQKSVPTLRLLRLRLKIRKAFMSNYRRLYENGGTYFFTVVTYRRQRFLCDEPCRRWLR